MRTIRNLNVLLKVTIIFSILAFCILVSFKIITTVCKIMFLIDKLLSISIRLFLEFFTYSKTFISSKSKISSYNLKK